MSENGKLPPRRKLYKMEDLPVERDAVELFGEQYELRSASEVGAEDMAEVIMLERRVQQQEDLKVVEPEAVQERMDEIYRLLQKRTSTILATAVDDKVMAQLSIQHHAFIYASFWEASGQDGDRLRAAMEATKSRAAVSTK